MAGGTFVTQNKIRPGAYVNLEGQLQTNVNVSDTGTLAVITTSGWGPLGEVREVLASEWVQRSQEFTGYPATNEDVFTLAMNNTRRMYFVRIGGSSGVRASGTIGGLTITALYAGAIGNKISAQVAANLSGGFTVTTFFDDVVVDTQVTTDGSDLVPNKYVVFSAGTIAAGAKANLTSGADAPASATEFGAALTALEAYKFDVLATDASTDAFKQLLTAYAVRNHEEAGKNFQVAMGSYTGVDTYRAIVTKNGVSVGTKLFTADQASIIYGSLRAGAGINQSLTYAVVPNVTDANPRLSNADTEAAILNGEIVFTYDDNRVIIETDINTQKTFSAGVNQSFRKNRTVATLNAIANDLPATFRRQFIGKVDANRNGLDLVRAAVISYLNNLQNINAIQNFNPSTDIQVNIGNSADSIVIIIYIQPVESIEKIYMTVEVR